VPEFPTRFVVGFAFCGPHVLLIRKSHPAWQAGKLNGVGGHIEPFENPNIAMDREFREETGHDARLPWRRFASIQSADRRWEVYFFESDISDASVEEISLRTADWDEPIGIFDAAALPANVVNNLHWLLPLSRDRQLMPARFIDISNIGG
jgi:8-oxo-dGTP diphosphatase